MIKYYISAIFSVILASCSQVLLKKGANKKFNSFIKEYLNPYVIFGYLILFVCTLLTVYSFKAIDYKIVAIIETLGYILVTIFGKLFFNEKITYKKILGNCLIIFGIIVFFL